MDKKNSTKILILGAILLIVAGIIVVALKGFDVSLMFGKHETIELKLGVDIDLEKLKNICNEVFTNKEVVVKELEVFGDSVQVNVESVTDEEKTNFVNRINEEFAITKTVEDLNISSISNKRIRDVVKPYIVPMAVVFTIIFVYTCIRFRKLKPSKILTKLVGWIILTQAILLSIIAIARIPVDELLINILMLIPIAQVVYCFMKNENKVEI